VRHWFYLWPWGQFEYRLSVWGFGVHAEWSRAYWNVQIALGPLHLLLYKPHVPKR
jgi:hypothetical protein